MVVVMMTTIVQLEMHVMETVTVLVLTLLLVHSVLTERPVLVVTNVMVMGNA